LNKEPARELTPGGDSRARDHMANTRTLLAWIRTSVALIGLGFVVARFGLFLRALDIQGGRAGGPSGLSAAIGVGLILLGVLVAVLSVRRFRQVGRSIDAGRFELAVSVELITAAAIIACA
jgi:putative membrane protein